MTVKQTLATIIGLGLSARYKDGEYRITYTVASYMADGMSKADAVHRSELVAAYESDAEGALETAQAFADRDPSILR